jgi:hypothetical protein
MKTTTTAPMIATGKAIDMAQDITPSAATLVAAPLATLDRDPWLGLRVSGGFPRRISRISSEWSR